MKNTLLLPLFLFSSLAVGAQPFAQPGAAPVKFDDMVKAYRQYLDSHWHEEENGEGDGLQFERWRMDMQQQLDENGYLVPFSKTVNEWQRYRSTHGYAAKTSIVGNWQLAGPVTSPGGDYSWLGRINTVAFDPVDSNTFYAGSPAGSTWKTTDGGHTWTVLYDNLPSNGVSDIVVNPRNRNTIYAVTGDAEGYAVISTGVIVSHDGGAHWTNAGSVWGSVVAYAYSLVINTLDTNVLLIATTNGVYKSTNAGASWTLKTSRSFRQLLYNPADTNVLYATTVPPSVFISAQIMRSADGGNTWDSVTNLATTRIIKLAVCATAPAVVKAIAASSMYGYKGLYSSADSGKTFTPVDTGLSSCINNILGWDTGILCANQATYDLCIAVDPADANNVTVGAAYTYHSTNGGATWQLANEAGGVPGVAHVHPDKHCLRYNPLSHALFEGSDGGIHKTYSPVAGAWTDLTNGISVTQFYGIAVNNNVPFVIGGSQDNGCLKLNGSAVTNLTGMDGFHTIINQGDPAHTWYTSNQFGVFITRDAGTTYRSITDTFHATGSYPWFISRSYFTLHPYDTATLLLSYQRQLYVSHNNGISWTPFSPVLDTYMYAGIMEPVRISTHNANYVYTVLAYGAQVIHYTPDFGASWDTIHLPIASKYISDITIDPQNEKHIWITLNGYLPQKVMNYDLTTNTWTDMTGSLPNIPGVCMVADTSYGTLYMGNLTSVFYRTGTMTDWGLYSNQLPVIKISELAINYSTGDLWAATYGRGMWRTLKNDLPNSVPGVRGNSDIIIFPNPVRDHVSVTAPGGIRNICVTNAVGQTVFESVYNGEQRIEIDVSSFAGGVYFIRVNGTEVSKMVKPL